MSIRKKIKKVLKKISKFILTSPDNNVSMTLTQIQNNEMLKGKKILITGGS